MFYCKPYFVISINNNFQLSLANYQIGQEVNKWVKICLFYVNISLIRE